MTSKLKCPFCGGEMLGCIGHPVCYNSPDCPIHNEDVPQELLDLLDRTKKQLGIARKALKDARILANTHCIATAIKTIDKALEQIEHKE